VSNASKGTMDDISAWFDVAPPGERKHKGKVKLA
jgi:hypothetical protein